LSNGRYSAAIVIRVGADPDDAWSIHASRVFTAGLLQWAGPSQPIAGALVGTELVDWGQMHVGAIARHDEKIVGAWEGVESLAPIRKVSHRAGGRVGLLSNGAFEREATAEEARSLPVMGTWGLDYLWRVAERVHVEGRPITL
jgi:hypothetical protein